MRMKTKQHFGEIELDPHKFEDTNGLPFRLRILTDVLKKHKLPFRLKKTSYVQKNG